jgi:hypothetical protein
MPHHLVAVKSRIIRVLVLAFAALLLGGCSLLRLSYGQLPTIAYWMLDGYVDFTSAQSERVREQLADWLRWNRATQLPDVAALLERARAEVLVDTTPARVCGWLDEGVARTQVAFEHALPAAADLARGLAPAQIDHMREHMGKANAELREEYVERSLERRRKDSVKRVVDRAETLYGRLGEAQREAVARDLAASPFDAERWLAHRQRRQRELLDTLRRLNAERATDAQAQAALRTLFEHVRASPEEAYRAYEQRLRRYGCEFAARLHNATTPEQRQTAAANLAGWENDLRLLAAEPAAAPAVLRP